MLSSSLLFGLPTRRFRNFSAGVCFSCLSRLPYSQPSGCDVIRSTRGDLRTSWSSLLCTLTILKDCSLVQSMSGSLYTLIRVADRQNRLQVRRPNLNRPKLYWVTGTGPPKRGDRPGSAWGLDVVLPVRYNKTRLCVTKRLEARRFCDGEDSYCSFLVATCVRSLVGHHQHFGGT
jgi:hypothetical protein